MGLVRLQPMDRAPSHQNLLVYSQILMIAFLLKIQEIIWIAFVSSRWVWSEREKCMNESFKIKMKVMWPFTVGMDGRRLQQRSAQGKEVRAQPVRKMTRQGNRLIPSWWGTEGQEVVYSVSQTKGNCAETLKLNN